jgi:hypothetical protein
MRKGVVVPADGNWELAPRKRWYVNEDADVQAVAHAFMSINIDTRQPELMNIIQFALKMFEDSVGMPQLLQGQLGNAPDTVGGMTMLQNNATAVLRRIARTFDYRVTEPHIRRYYEWLMLYSDDEDAKGDYKIDARGSTALIERDVQTQAILQMGQLVMNPAFGLDPELWIKEAMKAQNLDPSRFELSPEKKAKIQEAMQAQQQQGQGQQAPDNGALQVAQIRVQGDMQKAQLVQQSDMAELQFKAEEAERERQFDREMKQMEMQIRMMQFAETRQMSLDQVKAQLSIKAADLQSRDKEMRLKAQKGTGI